MAYDSVRHVTVLFGGNFGSSSQNLGDTWEYGSDHQWVFRSNTGPALRRTMSMAFDSSRGVCVLWGGYNGVVNFRETWEWDGAAWTLRTANNSQGPTAVSSCALAFDSRRNCCVLFGGGSLNGPANAETWEYRVANNIPTWTQVNPGGSGAPPARFGASMGFDSARGVCVMFGGTPAEPQALDDLWEWDGSLWVRRSSGMVGARALGAGAYDSSHGRSVFFNGYAVGGPGYVPTNDTYEWDGAGTGVWTLPVVTGAPPARAGGQLVYDSSRGVFVLFGGQSSTYLGDTWELRLDSSCYANCDGSTSPPILNVNDFLCFQSKFAAGCP
jgi:hypothetical protein